MAFDAGEIIAKLKLDRSEFNRDLDKALADAEAKTKKGIKVKVKPVIDQKDMAEVLAEEELLNRDIRPEVKPEYSKAEVEAVGYSLAKDMGIALADAFSHPIQGPVRIIPPASGELGTGGTFLDQILGDWFGVGGKGIGGQPAIGSGLSKEIDASVLRALGAGGGEQLALGMASVILPTEEELNTAFNDVLGSRTGGFTSVGENGGPRILKTDTNQVLRTFIASMLGGGQSPEEIKQALKSEGFLASDIAQALSDVMGTAVDEAAAQEGAGGGKINVARLLAAPFDALSGDSGAMKLIVNPLGASAATAFLGAFGAAVGGGLAATIIGSAGTMTALLPGFLDLMKGYQAYQAISTGASTKGMSGAQLGLGRALGGLMGAGSKGIGKAETQIMPMIEKFVAALTKAIPLINEFAQPAIKAMSGFFNAIDRGLGSGGFKSFMADMSKMVGPIMTEFGKVILNLGGALGGFLKLFGKVGESKIGPWFVKITGELDHFLNHVKLGHGFIAGMTTVFSNLGKVIPPVFDALKILGSALAPIGLQIFRIVGWMAMWADRILKMIPKPILTGILTLAVTLLSIGKGASMIVGGIGKVTKVIGDLQKVGSIAGKAMAFLFSPTGLIIIGVILLGVVIYELWKHWHTVWTWIKRITLDTWHFIDKDVFHPIADFFTKTFGPIVTVFGRLWKTEWTAIMDIVKAVWDVIKPIFDAIKTAIGGVVSAISGVIGLASKVGGAIGGAIGGVMKVGGSVVHGASDVLHFMAHPFGLAAGGPTPANKIQLVGENGPELFVPSTAGTVVPNGRFGGGQQIVFNINASGHSNAHEVVAAVRGAIGASLPSLQAALARGAA